MAGSDIEIEADVTIDNSAKIAIVTVTEKGSIIVKPKVTGGNNPTLTINGPNLEFRHYHNLDSSLRTFTWANSDGTASCSKDGGTTFGACTSSTSLLLSVAEFNSYPHIVVKVTNGAGTKQGELDLGDPTKGYDIVKFHTCTGPMVTNDSEISSISFTADGQVVCIASGVYNTSTTILMNAYPTSVLIGDHINRPEINIGNHFVNAVLSGGASQIVIANLKVMLSGSTYDGIVFGNSSFTATPVYSQNVISNLDLNLVTGGGLVGIILPDGQNTDIFDTNITATASIAKGIIVEGPALQLIDSTISMSINSSIGIEPSAFRQT